MPRSMTFSEERPVGTRAKKPVEELKKTRWWSATVFRHQIHVQTCKRLDCDDLIQPFFRFADEVMSTPEAARDSLLEITEVEPYVAFQRYPAYITPTMENQKLDFYSKAMGNKMRGGSTVPAFTRRELNIINIRLKESGKCIDCGNGRGEDGTKNHCRPCANRHNEKVRQRRVK